MILGFKKQFVDPIHYHQKVHTIRKDPKRRWKLGKYIHFATGVRTKNYNQFNSGFCSLVHEIELDPVTKQIWIIREGEKVEVPEINHDFFAFNDGFDTIDKFWEWFNEPFKGVIIHWYYQSCPYSENIVHDDRRDEFYNN